MLHPRELWRFLRDPNAPKAPKIALLFALAYVVMPIDLIPDMAPVITWLDDAGAVALAVGYIGRRAALHRQLANAPAPEPSNPGVA
jgi:uncharacterized membrane protein YkvA (DUF1232 family)